VTGTSSRNSEAKKGGVSTKRRQYCRTKLKLRYVFCIATVAAVVAQSASVAVGSSQGAQGFADFPLWKDIPATKFATLSKGRNRLGTRWALYAYRGESATRPCILLGSITRLGEYSSSSGCGWLAPRGGPSVPPVSVGSSKSTFGRDGKVVRAESFFAMTASAGSVQVDLGIKGGGTVRVNAKYLSLRRARKARVVRFRYVVFVRPYAACVDDVMGYDRLGNIFFSASLNECALARS
jgi:hypothetical protein